MIHFSQGVLQFYTGTKLGSFQRSLSGRLSYGGLLKHITPSFRSSILWPTASAAKVMTCRQKCADPHKWVLFVMHLVNSREVQVPLHCSGQARLPNSFMLDPTPQAPSLPTNPEQDKILHDPLYHIPRFRGSPFCHFPKQPGLQTQTPRP